MRSQSVRLFVTLDNPCGYFADRVARNLVIDPLADDQHDIYDHAIAKGFRRAGGHIYRPHCELCQACVSTRIAVAEFVVSKSQQRILKRNQDLRLSQSPAQFSAERFLLYNRYLDQRHPAGGMNAPSVEDFNKFVCSAWSRTQFLELHLGDELVAVAVTDQTTDGLSAMYTFYDPSLTDRSLGTLCILLQILTARRYGLPYVYLGYWIAGHPKMDYKKKFKPLECLIKGRWQPMNHAADMTNAGNSRA
jgi:leucyl-tRNA---protein transferase